MEYHISYLATKLILSESIHVIISDSKPAEDWQTEADKMSNSAVVRALSRRFNFYFNTPIFNKYGRSLRDFLGATSMTLGAFLIMLLVLVLFIDDSDGMTGIGSCGTADCIDQ